MIPNITMSATQPRTSIGLYPLANAKVKNNSISYTNNTKKGTKSKRNLPSIFSRVFGKGANYA